MNVYFIVRLLPFNGLRQLSFLSVFSTFNAFYCCFFVDDLVVGLFGGTDGKICL